MKDLINPDDFKSLAPAGFYIAIRVGFAFPMAEHNHLPPDWVREYTVSGLIVHDPAISWVYKNCGATRLGCLADGDTQGVLALARNYGLNFGAAVSCVDRCDAGQRTFGFFFRSDRDYTSSELDELNGLVVATHKAHVRPRNLTPAELETLGLVKNGLLMKEIACLLEVSESAIKQRLKSARVKLDAKTGTQAAARATMLGMI
jgi:LuxR family transcriptional regulator